MVAARHNRTAVVAFIQAVRDQGEDLVELELSVRSTSPVDGEPDLLTGNQPADQPWTVRARRSELPEGDLTGWEVTGEATLAAPGVVRLITAEPAPTLTPPGV